VPGTARWYADAAAARAAFNDAAAKTVTLALAGVDELPLEHAPTTAQARPTTTRRIGAAPRIVTAARCVPLAPPR
jgi:hypothetical protein